MDKWRNTYKNKIERNAWVLEHVDIDLTELGFFKKYEIWKWKVFLPTENVIFSNK